MKDGAVLANAGHFDVEIDLGALRELAVGGVREVRPLVEQYDLGEGRRLNLLARGRVVNLAAAEGHPAAVMDLSFAGQALAAEELVRGARELGPGVHAVPARVDREIADLKLGVAGRRDRRADARPGAVSRVVGVMGSLPRVNGDGLQASRSKMHAEGAGDVAVETFAHYYARLRDGDAGVLPEAEIEPVDDAPARGRPARGRRGGRRGAGRRRRDQAQRRPRHEHGHDPGQGAAGGQGRADLPRRDRPPGPRPARQDRRAPAAGADEQLRHARGLARRAGSLPRARGRRPGGLRAEQGPQAARRRPRRRSTGPPTRGSSGRRPGTATSTPRWSPRGCSRRCSARGYRWAFVSNADNLGAVLEPRILAWIARDEVPFVMEVADRTEADRKGGHLARRRDGGLVLREIAQTPGRRRRRLPGHRPPPLLQHEHAVGRPAGAGGRARAPRRRPGPADDRQPQDRGPARTPPRPRCSSSRRPWAPRSTSSRAPARCACAAGASRRSRRPTTCSSCARTPTSSTTASTCASPASARPAGRPAGRGARPRALQAARRLRGALRGRPALAGGRRAPGGRRRRRVRRPGSWCAGGCRRAPRRAGPAPGARRRGAGGVARGRTAPWRRGRYQALARASASAPSGQNVPSRRTAVARAVGLAGQLDPQEGVDGDAARRGGGTRAEAAPRWVAPGAVARGPPPVAPGVDEEVGAAEQAGEPASIGDLVGRMAVVGDVEREPAQSLDARRAQPLGHDRLRLPGRVAGVEVDRGPRGARERGAGVADEVDGLLGLGARHAIELRERVGLDDHRRRPVESARDAVDPLAIGAGVRGAAGRVAAAIAPGQVVDDEQGQRPGVARARDV